MKKSLHNGQFQERRWLYHGIPDWVKRSQYPYFITICLKDRKSKSLLTAGIAESLYDSLRFRCERNLIYLNLLVIMPDRLHMIVHFPESEDAITKIVGDWKSWTAKQYGVQWQKGFFEYRIRNTREWEEKDAYCRLNPVRAKLCDIPNLWQYTWPKTK